jgi:flagellar biosynthesis protein FliQ
MKKGNIMGLFEEGTWLYITIAGVLLIFVLIYVLSILFPELPVWWK